MKNVLLLACLALPLAPAAALEMGESPALEQAQAVQTSGSAAVYDHNLTRGSVTAASDVRVAAAGEGCVDETCGFRRGGPPPSELRKEPKSPFAGSDEDAAKAKKKKEGGFNWMGLVMIGVGAASGALAGFLIGGWIGAIVGAVLGGLLGWLAPKLMH